MSEMTDTPNATNVAGTPSHAPGADTIAALRHDLRNPIGQVIGYTDMLIEDAQDQKLPAFVTDLEKVRKAGKRLLEIVNTRLTEEAFTAKDKGERIKDKKEEEEKPYEDNSPSSLIPYPLSFNEAAVGVRDAPGIILVVDDVEQNRDLLARRLTRQGHTIVLAESGTEALENLAQAPFDLVLLDVMMPGMDGYETLSRIKSDMNLRAVPVIMVSALNEMDSVVRCIELGAADYLAKPFDPILLKARVDACLRDKRAHDREARLYERLEDNFRKLKELESLKDDLTHMIVHDLRTPLTSVLTGMQTVELAGDLNEGQQEMLTVAIDGGQTLLGMINDLLDIDKMEGGSLKLDYARIHAESLVDRSLRQVALLAQNKNILLHREIAGGIPAFDGDEDKLRRTLVNLIGNALKFTPSGGTVTLGAHVALGDPDTLLFFVRDTGEGIPQESFGRIFEKFGQVENRKGGRKMSTGLGLTFCKMAVEAHGGRIWVESELGHGSTFLFSIPRTATAA